MKRIAIQVGVTLLTVAAAEVFGVLPWLRNQISGIKGKGNGQAVAP